MAPRFNDKSALLSSPARQFSAYGQSDWFSFHQAHEVGPRMHLVSGT
jgi:hypothetical protein